MSLFDSAKDSFVATITFSNFAFSLASNPTGTQFAVAVNMQSIFILDNQLNTLGQAPVGGIVSGMVYSPDGKYLYIVSTPGQVPLISTIDATTFQLLGQASAYESNIANFTESQLFVERPMAADSTGMLYGIGDHGVVLDDSTDFQNISPTAVPPIYAIIANPAEGPQNSSTPVTITTASFSAIPDVWFGSIRGTTLSLSSLGQVQATAPPSSAIGPVNVKIISPDGTEGNIPEAFTYGAVPANLPIFAAAPSGGASAEIFGYGLGSDLSVAPQVQFGNQSASVTLSSLFPGQTPYPFPLDLVRTVIPAGSPGPADISITSMAGTARIPSGLHYVQSLSDYSSADAFQFVLYDPKRQQIYLSAGDHIDVFSLSSRSFLSPIVPPSLGGKRQFVWLALTPDDATLLASNSIDNSIAVINPDSPQTAQAVTAPPGNEFVGPVSIAPTNAGFAFIGTSNSDGASNLYQINLSTLQVSALNNEPIGPSFLQASLDGSAVFTYQIGNSAGFVSLWTAATGSWTAAHEIEDFIGDGAISGDGYVFATDARSGPGTTLRFFDTLTNILARAGLPEYLLTYPAAAGMKLNDTGSLAYVPVLAGVSFSENAVDIYDVQHNQLRERIPLSEQFPASAGNLMAIDPTGQNIFLATNAGLTVVTLDVVPVSIGHITPASGAAGTTITIYGSGFTPGITASFNGTANSVAFVDPNTLQAVLPASLTSSAVAITLNNPDGSTYTLDDAFTIN